MEQSKMRIGKLVAYAGAVIAFYIGAGFATMQEVMQYNASYGSKHWIVVAVCALIFIYTNLSFATNGAKFSLEKGTDVFYVYAGKYIGKFFDLWTVLFCYLSFWVMCGGASSTATQQFGAPTGVGTIVLVIAVVATVIFGLEGVVNALGAIGPVIIVCVIFTGLFVAARDGSNLAAGMALINSGALELTQVGGGNPFMSGASYAGFVVLWFAPYLAEMGAKNNLKEVNTGMVIGAVLIFTATVVCTFALVSNIEMVAAVDIPSLTLAGTISPIFSTVFSIIIFCGIYTTAVPLLWTPCRRFAEEGTNRYRILTIVLALVGAVAALFFPYRKLVNVVYGLNGYLGFVVLFFMIVADVRHFILKQEYVAK